MALAFSLVAVLIVTVPSALGGPPDSAELVKDINPSGSSTPSTARTAVVNGVLYFIADNGVDGDELWRSDGTSDGTFQVRNIGPGAADGLDGTSNFASIGDTLYFEADNGSDGNELWKSDGTAAGTVQVANITWPRRLAATPPS